MHGPVFIVPLWAQGVAGLRCGKSVDNAETRASFMHLPHPIALSSPFHGRLRLKPISTLLFTFGCCRNQGHRHYHENELHAGTSEPEIAFTTSIRPSPPCCLLRNQTISIFLLICTHRCVSHTHTHTLYTHTHTFAWLSSASLQPERERLETVVELYNAADGYGRPICGGALSIFHHPAEDASLDVMDHWSSSSVGGKCSSRLSSCFTLIEGTPVLLDM